MHMPMITLNVSDQNSIWLICRCLSFLGIIRISCQQQETSLLTRQK